MPNPDPAFDSHFDELVLPTSNDSQLPPSMDQRIPHSVNDPEPKVRMDQIMAPDKSSSTFLNDLRIQKLSAGKENEQRQPASSEPMDELIGTERCLHVGEEALKYDRLEERIVNQQRDDYLEPSIHDLTGDRQEIYEKVSRWHRRELFCFHCNRPETHSLATHFSSGYSFLIGLTLGLIRLLGPFYCRCCGHSRLIGSDYLHPKYWAHLRMLRKSRSRRRKKLN